MSYVSVTRNQSVVLMCPTWTDDICIVSGKGTYQLSAAFEYSDADVRLVLRRDGRGEFVVEHNLGGRMSYKSEYQMNKGDTFVLQWKALNSYDAATSPVAELSLTRTSE